MENDSRNHFWGQNDLWPKKHVKLGLGAVHKLRHFKIDLYGSSNNDSTWCYIPSGVLNNDEWGTKFTFFGIGTKMSVKIIT